MNLIKRINHYSVKKNRKLLFKIFSWIFMFISVLYLGYKLFNFNNYDALIQEWKVLPLSHFYWLAFVFFLLPLNWLSESVKWKLIVSVVQNLSLRKSLMSVLAGYSSGFFTPNRTGDMLGRLVFLKSSNRKTGITLSLISSLTQNIIIALCGIPAVILFFSYFKNENHIEINKYIFITSIFAGVLFILFLLLPKFAERNKNPKIQQYIKGLVNYSISKSFLILFVSLVRFIIFSVQFYAMLCFFGINLMLEKALIVIPANYLFITFTPSFSFTEPLIRGSYAVFFVGNFSNHTVGIALAGICLWVVNYVFPMLLGYVVLLKKAHEN